MDSPGSPPRRLDVLVGYDGSPEAVAAIETAARLLPGAVVTVVHLWQPPFASASLRRRLTLQARDVGHLIELVEREGHAEAERLAGNGVALATAAGWEATALVQRSFGGDGYQFARLAQERSADVVVVGSRGLRGAQAVLGSTSELVAHVSPVPVLVVPSPLTVQEREGRGPVVVGTDGSVAARRAAEAAARLFPGRVLVRVAVDDGSPPDGDVTWDDGGQVHLPRPRGAGGAHAVGSALSAYAADRGAAAVVVGSRGRSAGAEFLLGSVARSMLHDAHRPVLVVPSPPA